MLVPLVAISIEDRHQPFGFSNITLVKLLPFDYVLVYKLDRFSRNKYEMAIHRKHLKDNGIKILSAMENIPDTPEGILLESLLEGYEHSNGHNKNQIWIETVYIRCKSKAEFVK